MNQTEKEVNWRLTIRAALIITAVGFALFGVFHLDQIECRVCWKDVTRFYFSVFGYVTAFGFAIGWTLPEGPATSQNGRHNWSTRHGFWEGSMGLGTLMTLVLAGLHLFS